MRKMVYVPYSSIPSKWANTFQSVKMAQAFSERVRSIEIVTIGNLWNFWKDRNFDLKGWYGLRRDLKITRLPFSFQSGDPSLVDRWEKPLRRYVAAYLAFRFPTLVYTRRADMVSICLKLGLTVALEAHTPESARALKPEIFQHQRFLGAVTTAEALKHEFIEHGLSAEKIFVIHNGVDLDDFIPSLSKAEAREKLSLPKDLPVITYAGHLYEFKGVPTIYQLAHLLPKCRFLIAGGWEADVEKAREDCRKSGLFNVHFAGHVRQKDLPAYLFAADVLLLPPTRNHEWSDTTSPLKLFEYMAARRPIVASALKNITTVLKDGENGLFAEPEHPESFKSAIDRLLRDPERGQALAEQAFRDVQSYSYERRADQILRFLNGRLAEIKSQGGNGASHVFSLHP